jgi:uncharacterized protein YecE (DUF72 family)
MRGRLHVGTSGWVYPHWRKVFYPAGLSARAWLPFYAQHFATVELNNSFYRLPGKAAFCGWRDQVDDGFVFAVKDGRRQPVTAPVTADFVYLRRRGTAPRYRGSYTDRMLEGGGAAVRNALRLREMLGGRAL